MNGEKGCGFLFPLLIAVEKISEKWASCKTKIEGIPLAAEALPSPLLPTVSLVGINSVNTFSAVVQTVGIGFYEFLRCFAHRTLCGTPMGKLRQRGAQIRGKCWTLKEELSPFCSSWAGLMSGGLGWECKEQIYCLETPLLIQSKINPCFHEH